MFLHDAPQLFLQSVHVIETHMLPVVEELPEVLPEVLPEELPVEVALGGGISPRNLGAFGGII